MSNYENLTFEQKQKVVYGFFKCFLYERGAWL